MSEIHAYRANDELTAAWREHREARRRHIETVVKPFTDAHPDNDPLYRRGDCCGFRDGAPNDPPPAGLSRAKTRAHLFPSAIDFDEDGVWVYAAYEIENPPECVTAAKRSEFYAAQERAVERQERAEASS